MYQFENRKNISSFILSLEEKFPVTTWKFNDIHIWPYLRLQLFFYLIYKAETKNVENVIVDHQNKVHEIYNPGFIEKAKNYMSLIFSAFKFRVWLKKLTPIHYLFVASDAHRVNYREKRFNRFFDPIVDILIKKNNVKVIEYIENLNSNIYNDDLLIKYHEIIPLFTAYQKVNSKINHQESKNVFELKDYQHFLDFLSEVDATRNFSINYSIKKIRNIFSEDFNKYYSFFTVLLKKLNPNKIIVLCFYNFQAMALVAAANRLNIQTIEMQHGPQPNEHLSYGNWLNMPEKGFDMLPRKFWCWDDHSKNIIDKWAQKTKLYSAFNGGNTWIDYWNNNQSDYKFMGYILYSLQPEPVPIEQLFSRNIIEAIKNSNHQWFIRLHPRQINDKVKIEEILKQNDVLNLVNINEATNDPLPVLLTHSCIHVTHFSGSTIEADMLGVYTVLLDETGLFYFKDIVEKGNAEFINPLSDNFVSTFNQQVAKHSQNKSKKAVNKTQLDYDFIFNS